MKHFFDIGANVGQTFDYLATLDRDFSDYKFWLFEPSPRHLAGLIKKCESVKYDDVTICPFGIGASSRPHRFYEKDDVLGDSFYRWTASDHVPNNRLDGYTVISAMMSLPDFIIRFTSPGDEILLDIDSEGSEYEILSELMQATIAMARVSEIWVEWHKIDPMPELTPRFFETWCSRRNIRVTHRGLQNVA